MRHRGSLLTPAEAALEPRTAALIYRAIAPSLDLLSFSSSSIILLSHPSISSSSPHHLPSRSSEVLVQEEAGVFLIVPLHLFSLFSSFVAG
jgi:hypothetical protein